MGFYSNQAARAKCPLYDGFVKSKNNKITGVQCRCMDSDADASIIVRFRGFNRTLQHKRLYCDSLSCYRKCPFYKGIEQKIKDQP